MRATLCDRFKTACRQAGLKVPDVAKQLQVTERTVYAWFSGKVKVPYAAYRLLRIHNRFELPSPGWEGWHMHSGKLWSPEGFAFAPEDGKWWSLLVRQARCFRSCYLELSDLRVAMAGRAQALACDAPERGTSAPARGPACGDPTALRAARAECLVCSPPSNTGVNKIVPHGEKGASA